MGASSFTISPSWPHFLGILAVFLAVLTGITRYVVFDWSDPAHCRALVERGIWLDSARRSWQPDGCMLHSYKPSDGSACLGSKPVVFIGDSVTRHLFFQFSHILDSTLPISPDDGSKHSDHSFRTKHGNDISFFWDPFLNSTHTYDIIGASRAGTRREMSQPALLVLGSGLWYLRYAVTSGGLPSWESNMEHIINTLSRKSSKAADDVIILPVEQVITSKLSPERSMSMRSSDIDAMNSDLFHRILPLQRSPLSIFASMPPAAATLPLVFNQMLDSSQTEDGLHFSESLVKIQANILLNFRCNNVLPKSFPLDKTCCSMYPRPTTLQLLILVLAILWGPIVYVQYRQGNSSIGWHTFWKQDASAPFIFSAVIALIFVADRTGLWLKEHKQFDPWVFAFLSILSIGIGLATVKGSDKDLGFLNRDQTDEWKGWMQVAILIYHYLGASKISGIYNPIRVLVAAYLFMTGYGHTTFYLRKADFGFLRVAQVMVRLNILPLILAYTMNTDYISYYFSPLVSLWYLIIYGTMAIGSKYNDRTAFLVAKFLFSGTLFTWVMKEPWILEALFDLLHRFCGIKWSAREWAFRVNLDIWIVYFGMLSALLVIKIKDHRLLDHSYWPFAVKLSIGLSSITMFWFFGFELYQESKFTYNLWHPYVSFLPVLAFVVLRNASAKLRSKSSSAFAYVGRCSLETFIIQYHFWLAGDTKGVLLVIPGTRWRPINFVITTVMFIYISDRMAYATTIITSWICGSAKSKTLPVSTLSNASGQTSGPSTGAQDAPIPLVPPTGARNNKEERPAPEPDTPIRTRRWIDRLAEAPAPPQTPVRGWYNNPNSWTLGVRTKLSIGIGLMWFVNLMW